jgi:transposase
MVYLIDQDCRLLLYVAPEKTEASLRGFFKVMAEQTVQSMKYVCSDMWWPI